MAGQSNAVLEVSVSPRLPLQYAHLPCRGAPADGHFDTGRARTVGRSVDYIAIQGVLTTTSGCATVCGGCPRREREPRAA